MIAPWLVGSGVTAALLASVGSAVVLNGVSLTRAPLLPRPGVSPPEVPVDPTPVAVVPFRRLPLTGPPADLRVVPTAGPVGRRCRHEDLAGEAVVDNRAAGPGVSLTVRVQNRSGRPCDLDQRFASAKVIAQHGRVLDWGPKFIPDIGFGPRPPLGPGAQATNTANWFNWCGRVRPGQWRLRLAIPGRDADIRIRGRAPLPRCDRKDGSRSHFGIGPWQFVDDAGQPLGAPQTGLRLRIEAPSTARLGELFRFRMLVDNPTRADISLDPCPYYGIVASHSRGSFQLLDGVLTLNCAAAPPAIPWGKSVAFEVELLLDGSATRSGPPLRRGELSLGASLVPARTGEVVVPVTVQ